jgi:hypothetical protein
MVECFDRIHLKLAELVLGPLKELGERPDLTAVTVRPPGRGRRVQITVSKIRPGASMDPAAYVWEAREVDAAGADLLHGRVWTDATAHETPEAAYWSAVDTVATSRRRRIPV